MYGDYTDPLSIKFDYSVKELPDGTNDLDKYKTIVDQYNQRIIDYLVTPNYFRPFDQNYGQGLLRFLFEPDYFIDPLIFANFIQQQINKYFQNEIRVDLVEQYKDFDKEQKKHYYVVNVYYTVLKQPQYKVKLTLETR